MNYLPHLKELQTRAWRYAFSLLATFGICFWFSNSLYTQLAQPLLSRLPVDSQLVATQITSPFLIPLKCALLCAFLITLPLLLLEGWHFVKKGLSAKERKILRPLLLILPGLFYSGVLFSYQIICPTALNFFLNTRPDGVQFMIDIGHYWDFILSMSFYTGLVFETPVLTFALIEMGWVTIAQISYYRKYVIVVAFVLGMLLTPPDVMSQILLALPMWALFECGILASRWRRCFRQ